GAFSTASCIARSSAYHDFGDRYLCRYRRGSESIGHQQRSVLSVSAYRERATVSAFGSYGDNLPVYGDRADFRCSKPAKASDWHAGASQRAVAADGGRLSGG